MFFSYMLSQKILKNIPPDIEDKFFRFGMKDKPTNTFKEKIFFKFDDISVPASISLEDKQDNELPPLKHQT